MNVQRVAIEEKWARAKQLAVLDETAGAWTDENHPEMKTDEDIDRWLADLRATLGVKWDTRPAGRYHRLKMPYDSAI